MQMRALESPEWGQVRSRCFLFACSCILHAAFELLETTICLYVRFSICKGSLPYMSLAYRACSGRLSNKNHLPSSRWDRL